MKQHDTIVQVTDLIANAVAKYSKPEHIEFWQRLHQDPTNQLLQSICIELSRIDPHWTIVDTINLKARWRK